MTLIEEIDESIRLGDAFGNNAHLADILSDAKVLQQKIKNAEGELISLFQNVKSMKEAGLINGDEISDIVQMLGDIRRDVNAGNYSADKINMALKNAKSEKQDIQEIWDRYLRKEIGSQRGIVETLKVLVEDTQRYLSLFHLYNEIVQYNKPGDKNVLKKIDSYKSLADGMIKELELRPSIMRFFEKMASRNVLSLKEMTPEIWKWIQDNDFEDKFTIKIVEK